MNTETQRKKKQHDGKVEGGPAQSGTLQALAAVHGVGVLEEAHVLLADLVHHATRGRQLSQGNLVVVLVVQDVHQGRVEGVDVLRGRHGGEARRGGGE